MRASDDVVEQAARRLREATVPMVSYPWWQKWGLVAGTAMCSGGAIVFLWPGRWPDGWVGRLASIAIALVLLWLAFLCLRQLRYRNHTLAITHGSVVLSNGYREQVFALAELRFTMHADYQGIDVRDAAERLVYTVDNHATGARILLAWVESTAMVARVQRNKHRPRITRAQFASLCDRSERSERRRSAVFWISTIGAVATGSVFGSDRAGAYQLAWGVGFAFFSLVLFMPLVRDFRDGGNQALRDGLVCGACDGGLIGAAGRHALARGRCRHCGLPPFDG